MTDYTKLVEALRLIGKEQDCNECEAGRWHHDFECCLFENAAAAIESLQAEVAAIDMSTQAVARRKQEMASLTQQIDKNIQKDLD